jgi:Leucine-rich repeat (LRR) protein
MKLVDLHLNNNKFFRVPSFIENFQFLKFLDLGENFIKNLSDLENFPNLKYLYGLRLTENQIEVLERNHLVHLKNLQIVNLSKNRIRLIDRETFINNNFLQAIRLDGNHLKNIDYMFENLTQLVFLNMSENSLEVFDYENFPKNLQFLDISKNQINVIKNPNEISQNLKTLNLGYNHLTEISAFVLPRNLEDLYLQRNLIEKISPYTFLKKPYLKTVDMKHNKITHLSENSLRISSTKSDEKLPEFHLSGNPLVCDCHLKWMWQDNSLMSGQTSTNALKHLDIDNPEHFPYLLEEQANSDETARNYPTYAAQQQMNDEFDNSFDAHAAHGNYVDNNYPSLRNNFPSNSVNAVRTQPKIIDFDQMTCSFTNSRDKIPIRRLNPNLFLCKYNNFCSKGCQCCENYSCDCQQKCPDKCNCYHNTNWEINFVNCSSANYVKGLPNMIPMESTHLHLDGNYFETIKDFAFIGRRALRILYLNHSHIQQLTNRTFFGLKNLELLSLKHNEIQQLNGDEFNELESVKYLFLQYNRIETVESKTFIQLRQLQVLKLNGNKLLTFDLHFLPQNVIQFDITENLLDCDCELIKTLKIHNSIVHRDLLKCHPNQTRGEFFNIMNETNFCSEKIALGHMYFFEKNLPIFLIVFLVCLVSLIIVFIFHQKILFCCYKKFNLRFCKKRNDKNKFFDGFLMFSKKDENFLIDDFLKHFETEGSYYKFFLFFHDFSIFNEQILKNCENSQKIILFLSENFLKNEWKKIEFKKIFYEILKTKKRKKLLIVFLDNFDNKNFDPELKLILKTNFILRWGEKLFWEKFKFFLPSLNRNNQLQHQPSPPHDLESFCQNFHLNNLRNNPNLHQQRNLPSIHI